MTVPIFLDRDGTLIVEKGYLGNPKDVRFLPGVVASLKRLQRAGHPLIIVSNQSGVGRGLLTVRQVERVHQTVLARLKRYGVRIDGLYWCPHVPKDRCRCRKPGSALLQRAVQDLHVSLPGSISVGDRPSDTQLAQRVGGKGILVLTGYGKRYWPDWPISERPDYVAKTFTDATRWILKR